MPFEVEGHELNISASIGISVYPDDAEDIPALIAHADQAMYQVKRQGKNSVAFFEERRPAPEST
jgi:diguanylate cyclase (GGDEF)-like protein